MGGAGAGPVRLEIADGLATLTLARPEVGNAIDWVTADAFAQAAGRIAGDAGVRAVLLQGEGRNFCAGGDIREFGGHPDPAGFIGRLAGRLHDGIKALAGLDAPLVTAVQGACAGAGLGLAIGGDVVIAGAGASFTMAYAALGLAADGGASWLLPRLIGHRRAQEMALLNRRLSAAEAMDYRLVTRVVDDAALADESLTTARKLAAGPTRGFGAMKRLLAASGAASFADQLDAEARAMAEAMATEDARGAVAAFAERRPASFAGR